jgi:hypothetical protein
MTADYAFIEDFSALIFARFPEGTERNARVSFMNQLDRSGVASA